MPRKYANRRKVQRRRRRTRPGFFNQKYSVNQIARAAWKGVWKLKGLVNSEMHKLDMSAINVVDNSGLLDPMCKVGVGDTYADRTGNSVFARSLNIKGVASWNPSVTTGTQMLRLACVQDNQQIGDTNPSYTDVYEAASSVAHLNPATVGRFKILYDKTIPLSAQVPLVPYEINLPMRHHVRFNGTGNTDIQKGALYFSQIAGIQGGSTGPTNSYRARLSFHDN